MSYRLANLRRMGLAVATHIYAEALAENDDPEYLDELREHLHALDELLVAEKLPRHREATTRGPESSRAQVDSVPYSFVHYLRRAYARAYRNPAEPLIPLADGEHPTDDPVLHGFGDIWDCHLLCHSDCEGYYVPVDFTEVLFPEDELGLPGGMVGSSVALLRELDYVAPHLGINLVAGELTDAEIDRVYTENGDDEHPLYRERETWVLLYEAARVSVANSTVITFC